MLIFFCFFRTIFACIFNFRFFIGTQFARSLQRLSCTITTFQNIAICRIIGLCWWRPVVVRVCVWCRRSIWSLKTIYYIFVIILISSGLMFSFCYILCQVRRGANQWRDSIFFLTLDYDVKVDALVCIY